MSGGLRERLSVVICHFFVCVEFVDGDSHDMSYPAICHLFVLFCEGSVDSVDSFTVDLSRHGMSCHVSLFHLLVLRGFGCWLTVVQ